MSATQLQRAVDRAMAWIYSHPTKADDVALLADEAWFFEMMSNRHGARYPDEARRWRATLDALLDAALELDPQWSCAGSDIAQRMSFCDHVMGGIMLAHLLHRRRPGDTRARALTQAVYDAMITNRQLVFGFSFLYNVAYVYNMRKLGLDVPEGVRTVESYTGLPEALKFTVKSYYHTHVILFASDTLALEALPAEPYGVDLTHIRESAPRALGFGLHDLCSEFALCLSLCGQRDELFHKLVQHLVDAQAEDGRWINASYNERQTRHCNFLATLALLEAQRPAPEGP